MVARLSIAAGFLGGALHGLDAAGEGFVGEEGVEHDRVERPASERQRVGAEGGQGHRDLVVGLGAEAQQGKAASRSVVADDHFPPPHPAHEIHEVLHLGSGDPGQTERVEHAGDATPQAEREAPGGEPMHQSRSPYRSRNPGSRVR